MSEHLPRHRLEQLVADHARSRVPPALFVHVGACDQCRVRRRGIETARARYLATHSAAEFAHAIALRAAEPGPPAQRGLAALRAWFHRS